MDAPTTPTRRPIWTMSTLDLPGVEMTLTLSEWHRYRDGDDTSVVAPHQPELQAA